MLEAPLPLDVIRCTLAPRYVGKMSWQDELATGWSFLWIRFSWFVCFLLSSKFRQQFVASIGIGVETACAGDQVQQSQLNRPTSINTRERFKLQVVALCQTHRSGKMRCIGDQANGFAALAVLLEVSRELVDFFPRVVPCRNIDAISWYTDGNQQLLCLLRGTDLLTAHAVIGTRD